MRGGLGVPVHYVKLFIGDYMKKTAALSVAEHGAYSLMLMHYYATECPLPEGRDLYRLLRAETKTEREAVDSVARRFWTLTEDGLTQGRADEEIAKYHQKGDANRENGKLGGRPRKPKNNPDGFFSVSESEPKKNLIHNHNHITPHSPPLRGAGSVAEFPPGFDEFWAAYPRHVAKQDAVKAFAKLRADDALLRRILTALETAKQSRDWLKDGGAFVPYPATWLNGRRWEDEGPAALPAWEGAK